MQLREATMDDLETLIWWHQQSHIVDAGPGKDYKWEREINRHPDWRKQYMAIENDEPVGFVQICDPYEEDTGRWENMPHRLRAIDVWIGEPENLSKGYGTKIMLLAMAEAFSDPEVHALLVDPLISNKKAQRFYARFGFKFVETKKIYGESCYILKIRRDQYQQAKP